MFFKKAYFFQLLRPFSDVDRVMSYGGRFYEDWMGETRDESDGYKC